MKYLEVPIKDIIVKSDRGRKEFKNILELSDSIKRQGLINPLCVAPSETAGKYDLVAGERRYRASVLAGLVTVPVTFRDQQSLLEQKIMELEENTHREGLTWQEESELHAQIDENRRIKDPAWQQKQTAELVGVSPNHVSLQIKMARKLREDPSLKEAIGNLPINAAVKVVERREAEAKFERLQIQGKIQITTDYRLGDCTQLIKALPPKSVDLVVTDPPYGMEKLEALREHAGTRMSGHGLMSEDHNSDIESVLGLLRAMAPELIRVCKPGAHVYIFAALQYTGEFIKALEPLEFQPPILLWDRMKPTTPGYGYNYLNSTEAIIMFHVPPRGRRLAQNMYNILQFPEVPKSERVYPTQKPVDLLKCLIAQSSITGETVLDFCAGSASTLKAARALGRKSIGFEKDQTSWSATQMVLAGIKPEMQPSLLPDEQPESLLDLAKSQIGNQSN